jgi:hypothetical protein
VELGAVAQKGTYLLVCRTFSEKKIEICRVPPRGVPHPWLAFLRPALFELNIETVAMHSAQRNRRR